MPRIGGGPCPPPCTPPHASSFSTQLFGSSLLANVARSLAPRARKPYMVSPRDPLTFGSAFAVMTIASLAACFLPAWRATRTDPARALRD